MIPNLISLYFDSWNLQAARLGPWKLHMARYNTPAFTAAPAVGRMNLRLLNLELYNMDDDPAEGYDVSDEHPDVVERIQSRVRQQLQPQPDIHFFARPSRPVFTRGTVG